jgi:hypothetical protein
MSHAHSVIVHKNLAILLLVSQLLVIILANSFVVIPFKDSAALSTLLFIIYSIAFSTVAKGLSRA